MKRLFRIFELTKTEQRVVLIIMLILITMAFIGYERRLHRTHVHSTNGAAMSASPSP